MEQRVAFIGVGNMGGALLEAVCRVLPPEQITITDYQREKAEETAARLGCRWAARNEEAVRGADYIFLCVKPQVMSGVLAALSPALTTLATEKKAVLISIAAGLGTDTLRSYLQGPGSALPIVRIMPNTPVAVGQGMLAIAYAGEEQERILGDLRSLLARAGRCEVLDEKLFDQFTAVAGCGPAFAYLMVEAMADGGVLTGLPRQQAIVYAAQTLLGAAAIVLETGGHPAALKDAVCSPGGSTIAGVAALEEGCFRGTVIDAVEASYRRNGELG